MKQDRLGRRLRRLVHGCRLLLAAAAVTTIFSILFNYLMPQVIRFTVDSVIGDTPMQLPAFLQHWLEQAGGRDFLRANLLLCAGVAIVCAALSGVFNFFSRFCTAKASEGMVFRLRNHLYAHIQKLPYSWHVAHQTGETIQRCTSDVEIVRRFLSQQLLEAFRTVFLIVVSLSLMYSMNVKLALLATIFIPLVLAYSGIFYRIISKQFLAADQAEGELTSLVQENYTGVRVVRAFGRQAYEIDRFDIKNNRFANFWIKLGYVMTYYWGIGDFVTYLQVLCIIVAGAFEAVNGSLTIGEFMVFVVYNSMLVWPVRSLGRILSDMSKTGVSLKRIEEILEEPVEQDQSDAQRPDLLGPIVFERVSFGYHANLPVLHDVSFTIQPGTTVGLFGGTGSGKSTLMYLLDRLYDLKPEEGRILINGVDIREIERGYLRSHIGFVLQEPFLFSKTIRENIAITRQDSSMAEIRRSASIASVDHAIQSFSQGYDTVVGERGITLSGGQKQRVAIARTLMKQAPILVFDDSLSAVDSETDLKIRSALKQNTGESTVILISHRITTLMRCDQIVVLDAGRVVQQGSHDQLIRQPGIYQQITQMQGALEDELAGSEDKGGGADGK